MFVIWGTLHGIAIIIHRIWKDLGLRMWGWMGWLITFNFVNVAWVFFRAKNMVSVEKVLGGMIGLNGIVLPDKLADKLGFLDKFHVEFMFGGWMSNVGLSGAKDLFIIIGMLAFMVLINNSNQFANKLKIKWMVLTIFLLWFYSINSVSKISEFLYFNF
jgi:hypothetical protein